MNLSCRRDVVAAVVEICGIEPDTLVDDAGLETLGIDSLDLIEIAMVIEEQHGLIIDGAEFEGVSTFGDAVAMFDRLFLARSTDPGQ